MSGKGAGSGLPVDVRYSVAGPPAGALPELAQISHYIQKPESSRFLKVQRAAVDRELAELPADTGTSHGPVQLRLRDAELAAVRLGIGPARRVAPWIAEDPARPHDEALRRRLEVHIPGGLVIEDPGKCLRELAASRFVGFEVKDGPDVWLAGMMPWARYLLILRTVSVRFSRFVPTRRLSAMRVPSIMEDSFPRGTQHPDFRNHEPCSQLARTVPGVDRSNQGMAGQALPGRAC
jgi:hypothetical protein